MPPATRILQRLLFVACCLLASEAWTAPPAGKPEFLCPGPLCPGPPPVPPLTPSRVIAVVVWGDIPAAFRAGDTVPIVVWFDNPVVVNIAGGTPSLLLNISPVPRATQYDSAFGSGLNLKYVVQPGDTSADLDYVSTSALTLNGATIRDNTGADAILTLPAVGTQPRHAVIDGQAHPYLIWSNTANGNTFVWFMNGAALSSDAFITQVDPSWKIQGVADFNGDGHPDLVWRNTANGDTYVWYMNGTSFVSDALVFSLPPEWVIQGVADFNGDGKPDFLMRNTTSGVAFAWFFNDSLAIGDQFLFGIDPSWKVEAVADLDGDNQPDLLFRNTSSGLAFAWHTQFSGGSLSLGAASEPIFSIDPVWEIAQVEDWNGDRNRDLVFRNRDSGLVFVWYMTGTTLGASDFITQIDPSWEIVPRR